MANGLSQERDLTTKLEKVTRLVWWCIHVIPAIGETETGGIWIKANQAVSERPNLLNKTKSKKSWGCGLTYRALAK